ncbi:MAG: sulfate ABC transporter substrate-binding protein [Myxococcota bacterium]|jgi:sulfate transport system substrate-binding protein|nr:sulfate ABC transporter substrate-binding protein [Myxococcota bacterium]
MKNQFENCMVLVGVLVACATVATGCSNRSEGKEQSSAPKERTLTLAAYTTPREVYGQAIIPAFKEHWKAKTGQILKVSESYLGSGAQSRAVVAGFEADVVALSMEPDVARIAQAGLITHDWKSQARSGMVSRSIVVLAVRQGNPKGIKDWDDLARPDVKVLTPNVRTSGGAMWNIMAFWGAALRGHTTSPAGDASAATALLGRVLKNVAIMDKGARESMLTFESGVGDVAITYENEVLVGRKGGKTYEYVVPASTVRIDNPVAVVDEYANKHGNSDVAREFVSFLLSPKAQAAFAEYGLRTVDESNDPKDQAAWPKVSDLVTVDDLGGWKNVQSSLFEPQAAYDKAVELSAAPSP